MRVAVIFLNIVILLVTVRIMVDIGRFYLPLFVVYVLALTAQAGIYQEVKDGTKKRN